MRLEVPEDFIYAGIWGEQGGIDPTSLMWSGKGVTGTVLLSLSKRRTIGWAMLGRGNLRKHYQRLSYESSPERENDDKRDIPSVSREKGLSKKKLIGKKCRHGYPRNYVQGVGESIRGGRARRINASHIIGVSGKRKQSPIGGRGGNTRKGPFTGP